MGFPKTPPAGIEIQAVSEVLDRASLLRPDVLDLCRWIADYYLAPIGEVLKSALPPAITRKHLDRFDPGPELGSSRNPTAPFKLTTEQLTALYAIEKAEGFSTHPAARRDRKRKDRNLHSGGGVHALPRQHVPHPGSGDRPDAATDGAIFRAISRSRRRAAQLAYAQAAHRGVAAYPARPRPGSRRNALRGLCSAAQPEAHHRR